MVIQRPPEERKNLVRFQDLAPNYERKMKRHFYEVKKIAPNAFGVYSKDYGSTGGMHLLKVFHTEEECNSYIVELVQITG